MVGFANLSYEQSGSSQTVRLRLSLLVSINRKGEIVGEMLESRGGHPGLSVLTSLLVSVDVKLYWTMLRHWSQLVPNMSADIWGHYATLSTQLYISLYWPDHTKFQLDQIKTVLMLTHRNVVGCSLMSTTTMYSLTYAFHYYAERLRTSISII